MKTTLQLVLILILAIFLSKNAVLADSLKPMAFIEKANRSAVYSAIGEVDDTRPQARAENIRKCWQAFIGDNPDYINKYVIGKRILVKVNAVDPRFPDACSHPDALNEMTRLLVEAGADKVYVSDVPCGMFMEDLAGSGQGPVSFSLLQRQFEGLGYRFEGRVGFLDMRNAPLRDIGNGIVIYDVFNNPRQPIDSMINLALPKVHGAFGYTGCAKSFVGTAEQPSRSAAIHGRDDPPEVASANLVRLVTHWSDPRVISVLDGGHIVARHEHFGEKIPADFALVSRDAAAVDNWVLANKMELGPIEYLARLGDRPAESVLPVGRRAIYKANPALISPVYIGGGSFVDEIIDKDIENSICDSVAGRIARGETSFSREDVDRLARVSMIRSVVILARMRSLVVDPALLGSINEVISNKLVLLHPSVRFGAYRSKPEYILAVSDSANDIVDAMETINMLMMSGFAADAQGLQVLNGAFESLHSAISLAPSSGERGPAPTGSQI